MAFAIAREESHISEHRERRKTKAKVYARGNRLWVWCPDGQGGKVRQPLRDRQGNPVAVGSDHTVIDHSIAIALAVWDNANGTAKKLQSPANAAEDVPTFDQLETSFFRAKKPGWASKSVSQYTRWSKDMRTFFRPGTKLSEISVATAEQYKHWLLARGLSSNTVIHRIEFAATMWTWGAKMDYVSKNPFRHVERPRRIPKRPPDPFSPEEVTKILTVARKKFEWIYPCLLTAALTGCRRGALRLLQVRDWDAQGKRLLLRAEIAKHGRGHVYAVPPVLEVALNAITHDQEPDSPLFRTRAGLRLSDKTLDAHAGPTQAANAWRQVLDAAGVRPRGIHQLRSAVDSNLVMAGTSIDLAIAVTGHSKDVARDHYLRVHLDSQRNTMQKLAQVYGLQTEQIHRGTGTSAQHSGALGLTPEESAILLRAILHFEQLILCQNSGTDFWHTPLSDLLISVNSTVDSGMAERQGFEPWLPLQVNSLSRRAPSTTRPPLRGGPMVRAASS